jgi:AcrR family transcriptional regulator
LLRRHGPAKTNVVDVARRLGMSHANVYRHFASKAALQDAVAARWLHALTVPLAACAVRDAPAAARLREWARMLAAAKRQKVLGDPEMFATYHALAEAARGVVATHVAELLAQLERIIVDGMREGDFHVSNPAAAARAVQNALMRFHHPHFVRVMEADDAALETTLDMLVAGLKAGVV